MEKIIKTDAEWKAQLTEEQYRITRRKGTEAPFCGAFYDNKKDGTYHCVCCDLPLFSSNAKFISGSGWPSFFQPIEGVHMIPIQGSVAFAREADLDHHLDLDGIEDGDATAVEPIGMEFPVEEILEVLDAAGMLESAEPEAGDESA